MATPPNLPELSREDIVKFARMITIGEYLVADVDDVDWQTSLSLLISGAEIPENIGMVLVPMAPHSGGRWLNGRVPAVVIECRFVAQESVPALLTELRRMHEALHPGTETNDDQGTVG